MTANLKATDSCRTYPDAAGRVAGGRAGSPSKGALAAIAIAFACAGPAAAQSGKSICQNIGANVTEPFGDHPGHNLIISQYSCRMVEGPLAGSVMNGIGYWDARGGNWSLISGSGVARRPDGVAVFQQIEGKLDLQMKDGKPVGWTSTGKASYKAASGALSTVGGKSFRWKAAGTGPNMFTIDAEFE